MEDGNDREAVEWFLENSYPGVLWQHDIVVCDYGNDHVFREFLDKFNVLFVLFFGNEQMC